LSFRNIIVEKKDGVVKITLNRPDKLNAMSYDLLLELASALRDVDKDESVRVVVITGAGDRAFCAGADISTFKKATSIFEVRDYTGLGQEVTMMIENLGKPVIAAVNGFAFGGGCELAMACDLTIAAESAMLGQPEINLGILPGWGGTQRLTRLVGRKKAREMVFTGETITAKEAERLGLVNKAVPASELEATVKKYCETLMSKSPIALKMAKEAINRGIEVDLPTGLILEREASAVCGTSEDSKEGINAFIEKRKPQFKGK